MTHPLTLPEIAALAAVWGIAAGMLAYSAWCGWRAGD